jgi:hypothetical protein
MIDCVRGALSFAVVTLIMFVSFGCAQYAAKRFKTNRSLTEDFSEVFLPILKA